VLCRQPGLPVVALTIPECVRGNPPGGSRVLGANTLRAGDGLRTKRGVSLADIAQRPVHGFTDKVAIVESVLLDQRQCVEKQLVAGRLVMHRNCGECGKRRTPHKFAVFRRPVADLLPGVRSAIEQIAATGIADVPGGELASPPVHGRASDLERTADQTRSDAGIVDMRCPELFREWLVAPDASRDGTDPAER
jgi:hypothetical protein